MFCKLVLIVIGLLFFCSTTVFMMRINNIIDNYDIFSPSKEKQIKNLKSLILLSLFLGLLCELFVIWI